MRTTAIGDQRFHEIAPCLVAGPYSDYANKLIVQADLLGKNPFASTIRAWCVWYMFQLMERIFAEKSEPVEAVNLGFEKLTGFVASATDLGFGSLVRPSTAETHGASASNGDLKQVTGEHYGHLFKEFSDPSYWNEPVKLLRERLERNGISIADLQNKSVLDAGCGGGRYSVAWRLLGAKPVTGLDISPINVDDANRRIRTNGIDGVSIRQGDVLQLPFDDNSFDIVFSNGVLHHTTDWETGVKELVRVLKPGGFGWLYLIENPGGLFWDIIEVLRVIVRDEAKADMRAALASLQVPANRIFYMLDHVMVPINVRLSPQAIAEKLRDSDAINVRRLTRGCDFDRVESIHQGSRYATEYFGVGENRFVFSK